MARSPRIERAGAWHHITARGNERRAIYRDDRDRQHFCQLLGEAVALFGWRLHAYVLMDNHYHLLLETPEPNLGRGMQWLNTSYSVWFNRRHDRAGHLLQNRFRSIVVDPTGWGLQLSRYLHLNPVRVDRLGLGKASRQRDREGFGVPATAEQVQARLQRLRGYRWSSYRPYAGLAKAPAWLTCPTVLQLGGGRAEGAVVRYRRYVEDAIRQGLVARPWEELRDRLVLGGADFARRLARGLALGPKKSSAVKKLAAPSLEEIVKTVEAVKGEKWGQFRDRHGDWGRDLVFYLGRKDWGLRLRELGAAAGGVDEIAVSVAARRLPHWAKRDPALARAMTDCRRKLGMLNV